MPKKMTQQEFIARCIKIHRSKYDYSKVVYNGGKSKIIINCPIHGDFIQTAADHLQGKGCSKCSNRYKLTTEEYINKAKEIHGNKYDYSKTVYKSNKENVVITCKIHGDFSQVARVHLRGAECPLCRRKMLTDKKFLTTEQFISKAKEKHGDTYDYSLVEYKACRIPVKIICRKHGIFTQVPVDHYKSGAGCPKCARISNGEKRIEKWLENNNIYFIPQKKFEGLKDVKDLSYDFYLPNQNTVIEFNGEQHYRVNKFFHNGNRSLEKQQYHDLLKTNYAKTHNLKMITISYTDIDCIETILKRFTEKTNYTKLRLFSDESGKIYFQINCKYEDKNKQFENIKNAEIKFSNLLRNLKINAIKIN